MKKVSVLLVKRQHCIDPHSQNPTYTYRTEILGVFRKAKSAIAYAQSLPNNALPEFIRTDDPEITDLKSWQTHNTEATYYIEQQRIQP